MPEDKGHDGGSFGQLARILVSPSGIAVVVVIASLVAGGFSFFLTRPAPERQLSTYGTDLLNPESRMWQDPSQLIPMEKLWDEKFTTQALVTSKATWKELAKRLHSRPELPNAVLLVIGHSGSSPYGTEWRLRNRVAVLCALRAAGFVKEAADRTSFVLHTNRVGRLFLLPVEVFKRDPILACEDAQDLQPSSGKGPDFAQVIVFWIGERSWHTRFPSSGESREQPC
jgi:hypothetical protein